MVGVSVRNDNRVGCLNYRILKLLLDPTVSNIGERTASWIEIQEKKARI